MSAAVVSNFGYRNAPSFTVLSTFNVLSYNSVSAALLRNDPHVCYCDVSTELSFACIYIFYLAIFILAMISMSACCTELCLQCVLLFKASV